MQSEAQALLARSHAAALLGDHRGGLALAQQALHGLQADVPADPAGRALAQQLIALHHMRLGDAADAAQAASQAIAAYRALQQPSGVAHALNVLSLACMRFGLAREMLGYALQALALARQCGDASAECFSLTRAGVAYEVLGNPALARRHSQQALAVAGRIGGDEEIFAALSNLASSDMAVAERCARAADATGTAAALAEGQAHAEQALQRARASGNTHREAYALGGLCESMAGRATLDQGAALVAQYQVLAQTHGYRGLELREDFDIACVLRHRGRHALAVQRLERLQPAARRLGNPGLLRQIEHALYASNKALGRHEAALKHHEAFAALEREWQIQLGDAHWRLLLAKVTEPALRDEAERLRREWQADRVQVLEQDLEARRLATQAALRERSVREDPLTGLLLARASEEVLAELLRGESPPALVLLELVWPGAPGNGPDSVAMADEPMLAAAGCRLRTLLPDAVLLGRLAGARFVIVPPQAAAAAAWCERLREAFAEPLIAGPLAHPAPGVLTGWVRGLPAEPATGLLGRADTVFDELRRNQAGAAWRP
ncbi:hypothetical protein HLB44_09075 [Aquincola sp. S2]|uniref:GGDEF domain-containing protein n=1 Tax=Pseudaquabacterium terrae TaxID=2732868 RepID=A0ABX2EEV0_9BURK|nr:hypothetical protein [Aquabacterium terrae]NRF67132.1 hypothetical protein [Aquabacterium terrae]